MRIRTVIFLAVFAATLAAARPARASVGVSVSFFYDELSPYGRWATVGRYGDCWIPSHVAVGWAPYTDGHWIYTDYGWTWVSNDPWGGDPYHYGSWVWEDPWGWVWVPGTVWGPAWVTWCYNDAYVGWAPLPPTVSISYSGYAGPPVVLSEARYCFVPVNHFAGVRVSSVRLPVQQNAGIFPRAQKTTAYSVSRGIVVNRGPSVTRIEQAAHSRIPRSSISEAKARPVSLSQAGVQRGRRVEIASPAEVRAREIAARRGGAPRTVAAAPEHAGGASGAQHGSAPRKEAHKAPPKHEATPTHEAARHETASSHEGAPPHETQARHEAPPKHEAAPKHPKHEAPPPPPPPAREVASRHDAPPPEHEPPPRPESPPATHPAPPPHPERHAAPKHEPPPPPPPKKSDDDGRGAP